MRRIVIPVLVVVFVLPASAVCYSSPCASPPVSGETLGALSMGVSVNIEELAGELEILQDDIYVYLNRRTGGHLMVPAHDISLAQSENEDSTSFEWDWTEEELRRLRDIPENPDWIVLPEAREIREWSRKHGFGYRTPETRHLVELLKALLEREGIPFG